MQKRSDAIEMRSAFSRRERESDERMEERATETEECMQSEKKSFFAFFSR